MSKALRCGSVFTLLRFTTSAFGIPRSFLIPQMDSKILPTPPAWVIANINDHFVRLYKEFAVH